MSRNLADQSVTSKKLMFGLELRSPNGIANNLIESLSNYEFDRTSSAHYDERVRQEIDHGVRDLRSVLARQKSGVVFTSPFRGTKDKAMNSDDPVLRDQAVWTLAQRKRGDIDTIIRSIEKAPEESLAVSALLALQKLGDLDYDRVMGFLTELGSDKVKVNLAEWASLLGREIQTCKSGNLELMSEPVSGRKAVHLPNKVFDLTMPLLFQCNACTSIAGVTHQVTISPTWFKSIFGDAMACIRHETFQNQLVLEKNVMGLHADGSSHYEHFPFTGTTTQLSNNLFLHNYWSQIFRPFYKSGRVEVVHSEDDVHQRVPMTFARVAVTAAYNKYAVDGVAMPESVRGIFFGYGHIPPRTLLTRGLKLRAGDFQISSRLNPETGNLCNTYFYGTFFGKLTDTDSDGQLTLNGRSTHCDEHGSLDYSGKGLMDKDPVRPEDWQ
jgi:hypothetical protein